MKNLRDRLSKRWKGIFVCVCEKVFGEYVMIFLIVLKCPWPERMFWHDEKEDEKKERYKIPTGEKGSEIRRGGISKATDPFRLRCSVKIHDTEKWNSNSERWKKTMQWPGWGMRGTMRVKTKNRRKVRQWGRSESMSVGREKYRLISQSRTTKARFCMRPGETNMDRGGRG